MTAKPFQHGPDLHSGRAGFTLLEILTALAVIGMASTIFFRLFTVSTSLAASSVSHEVAANLAQELNGINKHSALPRGTVYLHAGLSGSHPSCGRKKQKA